MLSRLPPELLAIVIDKLDSLELCRACSVATALRHAEQGRAETLWRVLTLKRWPWAFNPVSIVSGVSSWKARYKVLHQRLTNRKAEIEPPDIDRLNVLYEFLLECSSDDMTRASTVPMGMQPYNANDAAVRRVYFGTADSTPLHIVGNCVELLVRRRADGAIASFVKMRRDDVPSDEERLEGAVQNNVFRIETTACASWAYDESVNYTVHIPAFANLESSLIAFRELQCTLTVVKEEAANEAMTSGALPVATWQDTTLDVKFDGKFLTATQVKRILMHKLVWAR